MLIEIDDSYVRSFLGKGHSDRAADSTVSPGDERYLVFKLSRTVSSAILYARPRLHLGLKPRLAILLLPGTRRLFFLLGHFVFAPAPLCADRSKPHAYIDVTSCSDAEPRRTMLYSTWASWRRPFTCT